MQVEARKDLRCRKHVGWQERRRKERRLSKEGTSMRMPLTGKVFYRQLLRFSRSIQHDVVEAKHVDL